jgi:NitT/TauT family transport system ATP-binding protein
MAKANSSAVIDLHKICMIFAKPSGEPLPVLADIDMSIKDGEILGLLGRSGSGKSTLLRIGAGLIRPTSGEVIYRGAPPYGACRRDRSGVPNVRPVPMAFSA